ncbi:MAG: aminotransferase class I/II-fold pyridoxal phosphate-dependent enzyme [Rhizobiales bacterium]|nr:aminotransferase class I/II-fold pyridoxal phosphate-dependent enzyme [Hyphomicrobiales bacterium]
MTKHNATRPVSPDIVTSTSFKAHPDAIGFSANDLQLDAPHFYTRWSNPTVAALEDKLAELEGGEAGLCFASGMAAISALFLTHLSNGDHLILSDVCYAGVAELVHDILPKYGIAVSAVDTSNLAEIAAAVRPQTKLIHVETPGNPILRLADIEAISRIATGCSAKLSIDSTIATPVATQPLSLGADYVVHSLSKYLCGHGDAIAGGIVGKADALASIRREALIHHGACLSPVSAWLILRGIETLDARMAVHERNARAVAEFLQNHPKVKRVFWPGLPSHPQHDLAKRQMANFSSLLAFSVEKGPDLARWLAENVKTFSYAVSLGKAKSLIFYIPSQDIINSSYRLGDAASARYKDWIGEGAFRVSIGLEDPKLLISELEAALENV